MKIFENIIEDHKKHHKFNSTWHDLQVNIVEDVKWKPLFCGKHFDNRIDNFDYISDDYE